MTQVPDFRICALVPCFDHAETVGGVAGVLRRRMPVIIVDDGSPVGALEPIAALADPGDPSTDLHPITVIRQEVNRGKGVAVVTGLGAAQRAGFTHALQVDADGQHDLDAAKRFVEAGRTHPGALVLGYPVYDQSIPRSRRYLRYLTHVWVWTNTLSLAVRDSMCGFRVYPVERILEILSSSKGRVARRMAFDIEICVRALWHGLSVVNEPVAVRYPPGGKSHFRQLQDNAEITWMHTRCFFGMLAGIPRRLLRRGES